MKFDNQSLKAFTENQMDVLEAIYAVVDEAQEAGMKEKEVQPLLDHLDEMWDTFDILLRVIAKAEKAKKARAKKQKEEEKMKNNTQVGDEILSIGGIYGKIIAVKEDSYIVETGPDRSKVRIAKWGIQQNFTVHENTEETAGKPEKKSLFGKKKKADGAENADNAAKADKEAK